jgi:hypothetical protein
MNNLTGKLFVNDPKLLDHLGKDVYLKHSDNVIVAVIDILEKLLALDKSVLLQSTATPLEIYRTLDKMPHFRKDTLWNSIVGTKDGTYSNIPNELVNDVESRDLKNLQNAAPIAYE